MTNDAVPVTAEDREAAKQLLDQLHIREHETGSFRAWDETVQAFARHRGSTAGVDVEQSRLSDWRSEITHPNNRLLFRRMAEAAGIDLGLDDIPTALEKVAALASLSQTPATPMDELQRLGQEFDGAVTIPTDHPLARSLRTSQKTLDEMARQEQANIAGYMALRDFPVGSTASPMVQEGLREAAQAVVDEAARMTMTMRRRKIFDALVNALSATPAPPVDETDRLARDVRRALTILERNLHRQTEKCDDAVNILRAALADRTQEGEVRRG